MIFVLALYVSVQDKRASEEGAQKTTEPDNHTPTTKADEKHTQENVSDAERNTPGWYGFFRWPNGTTTWAIILTLIAIAEQAGESAKATRAVRDSLPHQEQAAKAASRNAEALINAERAWVIPELQCLSIQNSDGSWVWKQRGGSLTIPDVLRGKHLQYILKLTNMGRTPAHVLECRINSTLLAEGVRDLPPNSTGDTWQSHEINQFIAGGESAEITEPLLVVADFIEAEWLAIRGHKKTAVFHGWVKYRHMFSPKEDTAEFCYVYTVSLNRLSSVASHTKYTQQHQTEKAN